MSSQSQMFLTCGGGVRWMESSWMHFRESMKLIFYLNFFFWKGLFITFMRFPKGTGNQKNLRITVLYDVHAIFFLLTSKLYACKIICILSLDSVISSYDMWLQWSLLFHFSYYISTLLCQYFSGFLGDG